MAPSEETLVAPSEQTLEKEREQEQDQHLWSRCNRRRSAAEGYRRFKLIHCIGNAICIGRCRRRSMASARSLSLINGYS
jgi:hypothetical protein